MIIIDPAESFDDDFQFIVLETIGLLPYIIQDILLKDDGLILSDMVQLIHSLNTPLINPFILIFIHSLSNSTNFWAIRFQKSLVLGKPKESSCS